MIVETGITLAPTYFFTSSKVALISLYKSYCLKKSIPKNILIKISLIDNTKELVIITGVPFDSNSTHALYRIHE